jgi:hypothetical protein
VAGAVAAAALHDFQAAHRIGRAGLRRARGVVGQNAGARRYLDDWEAALAEGPQKGRAVLLDRSDYGHDMRQMSPLAGVLSEGERRAALAAADALFEVERLRGAVG